MKLVRLIAPEGCAYRIDGKDLDLGPDREVDVPESMVPDLLREGFTRAKSTELVLMQGPQGVSGIEGKQGEIGPRGPQGLRGLIGPMPQHEWSGTELRFQLDVDQWGAWVDLQGPAGKDGTGGVAQSGLFGGGPIDLSALNIQTSVNSYFPAGW